MDRKRLAMWFDRKGWSDILILAPYIWLLLFFLLPFIIVVAMSVGTKTPTAPPISFGGDYPLYTFERLTSEWKAEGYSQTILDKVFQQNAEAFLSGVDR